MTGELSTNLPGPSTKAQPLFMGCEHNLRAQGKALNELQLSPSLISLLIIKPRVQLPLQALFPQVSSTPGPALEPPSLLFISQSPQLVIPTLPAREGGDHGVTWPLQDTEQQHQKSQAWLQSSIFSSLLPSCCPPSSRRCCFIPSRTNPSRAALAGPG